MAASKGARGVRLNPAHDSKTRAKIRTSQIINRLEKFVLSELGENGEVVMLLPHQITAALGLLKKTLPDLTSTDINVDDKRDVQDLSTDELVELVSRSRRAGGNGTAEAEESLGEPDSVH